jgi:hypothetical protein
MRIRVVVIGVLPFLATAARIAVRTRHGQCQRIENQHQVQNGYRRAAVDKVDRGPIEQLTAAKENLQESRNVTRINSFEPHQLMIFVR